MAAGTELTEDVRQIPGAAALPSRLRPSSDTTTVRVRDGELLVSDGPFAETKEQMAGFDIIECPSLDECCLFEPAAGLLPRS